MNVSHDTLRLHRRTAMIISFIMQVPPFEAIHPQTIPNVDVLIGNETDATTFVETDGWEEQDVPFIVKRLSALVVIMQCAHPRHRQRQRRDRTFQGEARRQQRGKRCICGCSSSGFV